jgi:hypothetical protein
MSLGVAAGASGGALRAGFVGGLTTGFDIANFAGAAGATLGAGDAAGGLAAGETLNAAGGALDVIATAGPALLPFAIGALLAAFAAGAAGS